MPQLWIIAGPNGAGKSTLVTQRVARRIPVVNPDDIAIELEQSGGSLNERRAGSLAIARRNELIDAGASFAVETTLSGNSTLRLMRTAKTRGYRITLVFVGLRSVELSLQRVADRVRDGGHAVPVDAITRRFPALLSNLPIATALADRSYILDNSDRRRRLLLTYEDDRIRSASPRLPQWARGLATDMLGPPATTVPISSDIELPPVEKDRHR